MMMIKFRKVFIYILFVLTLLSVCSVHSQNILTNGGFENGGSGTGFLVTSPYSLATTPGTSAPGNYAFVNNPQVLNGTFNSFGDHTTGTGKMMVVDGSTAPGLNFFWTTGNTGGAIPGFVIGQSYIFSYWIKSISNDVINTATQAVIAFFSPDATNIVPPTLNSLAPLPALGWQKVSYTFTATDSNVLIRLSNSNTSAIGNDFAIDDMSIVCATPPILNINNPSPVCSPSTVNLELPPITAGSDPGLLEYYTDPAGTAILSNPTTVAISGTYYIKLTSSGCVTIKPVVVTIAPSVVSPPVVTTPIYLCDIGTTPLIATPSVGHTLKWYGTNTIGGTASSIATIPGATGTYYVSQTIGVCESGRVAIQANLVADNGATISTFRCDSSQIPGISLNYTPPATVNNTVLFDWAVNSFIPNSYNYSYRIQGGPLFTGNTAQTSLVVTGLLPGQSVEMTLTSALRPCVPPETKTCTVPCPLPLLKPNFPLITNTYCLGSPMPVLSNTSPTTGIQGTWSPAVISNATSGTYTFTPDPILSPCAETQNLFVTVIPVSTPTFGTLPVAVCENAIAPILPTISTNLIPITGNWDQSINTSILGPKIYTFLPDVGQCVSSVVTSVVITVNPSILSTFSAVPDFCSGTPAPSFPLSNEGIIGTWLPNTISNAPGTKQYQFTPDSSIYPCAPIPPPLIVNVIPSPTPTFLPSVPTDVCENAISPTLPIASNNSPPITGFWETSAGTVTTIDTSIVGTESYTFTPNSGQCAIAPSPFVITVHPSNTLTTVSYTVSEAFTDNQIIEVTALSTGDYLYQLDFGPPQTSPIFENVTSGKHSITVSDANGCSASITENDIIVMNYSKFFTPNGDGFNDTWKIADPNSLIFKIYIFDRYGKLLKEISPGGPGWDGTFIGQLMPADDYWFQVKYIENLIPKKFNYHFTLKR